MYIINEQGKLISNCKCLDNQARGLMFWRDHTCLIVNIRYLKEINYYGACGRHVFYGTRHLDS